MYKHLTPALFGASLAISVMQILPDRAIADTPIDPTIPTAPIGESRSELARQRIVTIETRSGQGSGTIVRHVANTYTILTAAHVVNNLRNAPFSITTPDRQQYIVNPSDVKIAPNSIDLATITFQSDRDYAVAELGDSHTLARGQRVFIAGFQGKMLKFFPGTVVASSHQAQAQGYGVVFSSVDVLPGMSGGGLFTDKGSLIGINGKSIGTMTGYVNQSDSRSSPSPQPTHRIKAVSGLAIPIDTFTQIASQLSLDIAPTAPIPVSATLTADDLFITAQEKSEKGDYPGAIADYNRALAIDPKFLEIYFRRGIARSLTKDWSGAEADYTQAIAIDPEHPEVYLHRGSIRNIQSNWQGAKVDFNTAIYLNPNAAAAYIGRGFALCELQDCQRGLKDYDRAIALDPNSAEAYQRRAHAYHRLGNNRTAIANYVVAAELYQKQGKDIDYLNTVAKIKQLVKS
ncbi:tetratricopeptide repeat-containing serine protease family protein [Chamaesiphon sp. VAR_69_metabat_338]|uniref:tetratricopeptide repeat-containing S1 family peptidase n=1 Tax=Chamaesiphon sp. VAR_69_metabat_338 TaxID=2964704 RepID=UPI00286DDB08|nr:tetratricopeptide repeat-containing serine protease family protein [Chamaesiphon sp. VAR_69_metabat_338]